MKILHITNDYSGSTVYKNLVTELDSINISQTIYNPIRDKNKIGKNKIKFVSKDSEIIYSLILNEFTDRLFLKKKINKIVKDIERKVDVSKISFIHAHTWFSDGSVAYQLYKKYKTPYIVTVRNTDLNLFFKYMLHLRSYGLNILKNATKIIFISPVYLNRLFDKSYFIKVKKTLKEKSEIIPNGIDPYWITNVKQRKNKNEKPIQLLYIGKFNKGKNVIKLLEAVLNLNKKEFKYHLNLVGGGGNDEVEVLKKIKDNSCFTYHGKIFDKNRLAELYCLNDIFTMPSHAETFGLVYIEALSQGIPVIYTLNEGIFGFYDQTIGEAVNSKEVRSIEKGIHKITKNYQNYSFNPTDIIKNHDWNKIAKTYQNIYK